MTTDRIEKEILLRAPRARVWKALTTASEFGAWFGVKLESEFSPGARVKGQLTFKPYEHIIFDFIVDRIEPEHFFSYRWHPYALDPKVDYSSETPTLVEFRLEAVPEGTRLTVIESGFDRIPVGRRAEAFRANAGGWAEQLNNIARHVTSQ